MTAERRKGGGPVLGVRLGSGRPGPSGTAPGFDPEIEVVRIVKNRSTAINVTEEDAMKFTNRFEVINAIVWGSEIRTSL